MSFTPLVRLWLWISVFAVTAGWTLSAFGQLNRAGYGMFFIAFIVFFLATRKGLGLGGFGKVLSRNKFLRRFRRPLPLCFALLTVLIFLGGMLYPPSNYTGISYRLPRVLQWRAHEQWCWIQTNNYRMNDRACGVRNSLTSPAAAVHQIRPRAVPDQLHSIPVAAGIDFQRVYKAWCPRPRGMAMDVAAADRL